MFQRRLNIALDLMMDTSMAGINYVAKYTSMNYVYNSLDSYMYNGL